MRNETARRVAFTGLLFALAIAFSFFESLISGSLLLPPGVKLGLANMVVVYALLFISRRQALLLVVLKAGFGLLTRGATAGLLSLAGGLLSLGLMVLLLLPSVQPGMLLLSVAGSLGHNLGQFAVILLLFGRSSVVYLPVLLLSGVGMGVLTALSLRVLLPALHRAGLAKNRRPPDE